MNARAGFLLVALAAVFTFGLIRVFSIRFATGDIYPSDSTMRANPEGAKLLYDALARTPGLTVRRNFSPLEYLDDRDSTIFFLGLDLSQLAAEPETFERLAKRGNRVVATLKWDEKERPDKLDDLEKRWNVKFSVDKGVKFGESKGWRALEPDVLERDFAPGSVVLFAGSRDFRNSSTVQLDRLAPVAAAIGANRRIVFDEEHFGIAESGTVVGLARRFRLSGMAFGLALCAALFIWKNSVAFPPPVQAPRADTLSGRTSLSGLVTLLRRYIKPADLAATCWSEWLATNRNNLALARKERAEAILRERGRQPLEAVREIETVLHSKGPL